MQNDPTLALNLAAVTEESRKLAAAITPGSARWDVIVVGSGAAGGMAAFQLAMAGVKVLLLEAGRMIDVRTEYRTMEWPYASMRRHRLPPGERPIGGRRIQLPRSALRQQSRAGKVQEGRLGTRPTPSRGTGCPTSARIRPRARRTRSSARGSSAGGPTSGDAGRCATDRCSSRPRVATASTSIGRSPTTT